MTSISLPRMSKSELRIKLDPFPAFPTSSFNPSIKLCKSGNISSLLISNLRILVTVLLMRAGLTPGSIKSKEFPKVLIVKGEHEAEIRSKAIKACSLSSEVPFSEV